MVLTFNGIFGQHKEVQFKVAKYQSNKECAISYTFDDGLKEHYYLIMPKLDSLGFKATFWINGNTINLGELGQMKEKPRLTWRQLKEMSARGHEVSNHGWTHKKLTACTPEEMKFEIEHNDDVIEEKIGIRPVTFCYPNNSINKEAIKMASQNRVGTRLTQFQMGRKSTEEKLLNQVDSLLLNKDWCVTMIHGISYGYDAFKDVKILWSHMGKIKSLEDKIWVGTFKDIATYVAERDNINMKILKKKNGWNLVPNLSLEKKLFNSKLTMIVENLDNSRIKVVQNGKQIKVKFFKDDAMFDFDPNGGKIRVVIN